MACGKKRVTVFGLALLAVLACAYWWHVRRQPRVEFFGLVVDERGEPVFDAEVHVYVGERRMDQWGFVRPIPGTGKDLWLRTDTGGRFALQDVRGNYLGIAEVSKPDHQWVFDYGAAAKISLDSNQNFSFHPKSRMYIPDASRPAIFPLFRNGSLVLGRTSRGGSDRYLDGRVVRNELVTPLVPSAGFGAPANREELEERLLEVSGRPRPPSMIKPGTQPKAPMTQADELPL